MVKLSKIEKEITLLALVVAAEYYESMIKIQKSKAQKLSMWGLANNARVLHASLLKRGKA